MFVGVKLSSRIITSKKHICFHRDFFSPRKKYVEAYLWVQEMQGMDCSLYLQPVTQGNGE